MILRRVFRLGGIEVGEDWVRYFNRTAKGGPYRLTPAQAEKWRAWMIRQGAQMVGES